MKQKSSTTRVPMKHLAIAALMLNFGVAGIYAQPGPVNMTVSGTAADSTINLRPGTPASEYDLAGNGTLGPSTLRVVSTSAASPQQSKACSGATKVYFSTVAGAGVLRSQDGSLLKVFLTGGGDCIDFSAGEALCTRIFQITGGTGRFKDASGDLTLTETDLPVSADALHNPVFFADTGEFTGTVSGVAREADRQEEQ